MVGSPRLGGMVPSLEVLKPGQTTEWVDEVGRPNSSTRELLRRIPSVRNGLSVVSVFTQTELLIFSSVRFGPIVWIPVFLLMGRARITAGIEARSGEEIEIRAAARRGIASRRGRGAEAAAQRRKGGSRERGMDPGEGHAERGQFRG